MNFLATLVTLVVIGSHVESGSITPLYAVRIGDTTRSEQLSTEWMPYFGANAINGAIYTHAGAVWRRTMFVRPSTVAQSEAFYKNRAECTHSDTVVAPPVLHGLGPSEMDVDYVVEYFDGGAKVYLKAKTPQEEAAQIAAAIQSSIGTPAPFTSPAAATNP